MRRRTKWAIFGVVILGAIVCGGTAPQYALGKELQAARQEGLWTTPEEIRRGLSVPEERNAALPIRKAISGEHPSSIHIGTPRGANPDGSPIMEWREIRDAPLPLPAERRARLARWRAVARYRELVFARSWEPDWVDPMDTYGMKEGIDKMLDAAQDHVEPDENLAVAAGLCRLLAQDSGMGSFVLSLQTATRVLDAARALGRGALVLQKLGPAPSLKASLRTDLVTTLTRRRGYRRENGWATLWRGSGLPWRERVRGVAPFSVYDDAAMVRLYRTIWRDLGHANGDLSKEVRAYHRHREEFIRRFYRYSGGGPYAVIREGDVESVVVDYLPARQAAVGQPSVTTGSPSASRPPSGPVRG